MDWLAPVIFKLLLLNAVVLCCECCNGNMEEEAKAYLAYLDVEVCKGQFEKTSAEYNYYTNMTDENMEKMDEQDARPPLFDADYVYFDWDSFSNTDLKRQANFYTLLDKSDPELYKEFSETINEMIAAYSAEITLCLYQNKSVCGSKVNKIVSKILETSTDSKELEYYWLQIHEVSPRIARPLYKKYVDLSNKIANLKNFSNRADQWMAEYEDPPVAEFEKTMLDLWEEVKPLYLQFFSYIRGRLRKRFGEEAVSKTGPIPMQLIDLFNGDIISSSLKDLVPYPNKPSTDVTSELIKQNYTVVKMIRQAEDFYTSMGLEALPDDFWQNSQFVRPTDGRQVPFCGTVDYFTFKIFVHELGHLHNFLAYRNLPCCYRVETNSGLDEAIAETMVLSFQSYKHLQRLGLIMDCHPDYEVQINSFYNQFMFSGAALPTTLALDQWRWKLFRGEIAEENYNKAYWEIRTQLQGLAPPVERSEEYLDAAMKIHMLDDTQTVSYLISFTLNFQNYEALCIAAGEYDPQDIENKPLHNCDLYGNKKVGQIWNNMLKIGSSKPWTASMKAITGKTKVDGKALLRYYEPFHKWLIEENKKNNEYIGWK